MSTFRGTDGAFTIGGTAVGEMESWDSDIERSFIDETVMGDSAEKGSLEIPSASGTAVMNFDYGDAQQAAMVDQVLAGTVPSALAAVFRVATGKEFSGNILITRASIRGQVRGGNFKLNISWRATGGLSVAWA